MRNSCAKTAFRFLMHPSKALLFSPKKKQMETTFGSLRLSIAPTVYQPAEDSFLLATYASGLAEGKRILEIGCGSGIVSLSAAAASQKNEVLSVDINAEAVKCARQNAELNGIGNVEFAVSDLFSGVGGTFDCILFNPPYLPTTREERLALEGENAAYDGGGSGLAVFMRFAASAPPFLAPGGKAAVVATSLGEGIKKTIAELELRIGPAQVLAEEIFFFEKIALIESTKR